MIITNKVNMDLQRPSFAPAIHAVQNDKYSRNLELTLLSGGEAWMIPDGVAVLVRYSKSDGKGGMYDTLPDGTKCYAAKENVLTVVLAPQVLSAPGPVRLSVTLLAGEKQLTTFLVLVNVQEEVGGEIADSEDYFNVTGFLPAPASGGVGQYFRISAVDENGHVTGVEAVDLPEVSQAVLYAEQTLTEEEKIQARDNIGAVTLDDVLTALEGSTDVGNLLEGATWKAGYLTGYGTGLNTTVSTLMYGEAYTEERVSVTAGIAYTLIYRYTPNPNYDEGAWWAVQGYKADGTFSRVTLALTNVTVDGSTKIFTAEYIPADGVTGIRLSGRTNAWYGNTTMTQKEYDAKAAEAGPKVFSMKLSGSGETVAAADMRLLPVVGSDDNGKSLKVSSGKWSLAEADAVYHNPHLRAVNHRGYCTVAPENTLSAYRLSKKMGFAHVECDVSFTSDGVAVLLHDSTVDRTSNGTGSISALTLAEVKALDFGSWMSEDYAGETIPTFEEFIILCKQIGLHPYIEIKSSLSSAAAASLTAVVKRYGMQGKVTWISFYEAPLAAIKTANAAARLGFVTEAVSEDIITTANTLKTGKNEVFLDVKYSVLTEDAVSLCVDNDLPLEVWTIDDKAALTALDSYVSGYTSNQLQGNVVLYDAFG